MFSFFLHFLKKYAVRDSTARDFRIEQDLSIPRKTSWRSEVRTEGKTIIGSAMPNKMQQSLTIPPATALDPDSDK